MKTIKIWLDSETIKLEDSDETPISDYITEISNIFNARNLTILDTTSGSVILRPSKINGIEVKESNSKEVIPETIENDEQPEDVITEDIITDGE